MTDVSMIHKKDLCFNIVFSISNHLDEKPSDCLEEEGELYISGSEIYFGNNKRWFKVDTREIQDISAIHSDSTLSLTCDIFTVNFKSDDYTHLRVIRDALFLFMNSPLLYQSGPKGLPGVIH